MCVSVFMITHTHTHNPDSLRNHIMQWNDCETSARKDTQTPALSHEFPSDYGAFIPPLAPAHQRWKQTHACTQALRNAHIIMYGQPSDFKSLAGSEFSCSQNALLLLCLTGAWFELGPVYLLSLLSSQHTGEARATPWSTLHLLWLFLGEIASLAGTLLLVEHARGLLSGNFLRTWWFVPKHITAAWWKPPRIFVMFVF